MVKGIIHIYKYDHMNWPNPPPNTTFIISQNSVTSIPNQRNSASDASVDVHDVASSGLDQSTNHHGNMDVNYNDDSQ